MKKSLGFAIFILLIVGTATAQISRGGTAWVSAKTVNLKSSTGFFASNRGTVAYGDEVSVLQVSGNWAEVRSAANVSGWISTGNLSAKRIAATGSTSSASASEVALAGKGFNQEVEDTYKAGGNLNYADVDRTEAITVNQDELHRFVTEGRLSLGAN
jgi:uncharacterized protein YgiM (DUF1202 family)